MTNSNPSNWSEQALNKAIEVGLSSQLEDVEEMEVAIQTEPLQLVQGEVESVRVQGRGVVTPQLLRLEEVILRSNHVAVNILATALGSLQLKYLEDASLCITLTEADCNQVLHSDYLKQELSPLTLASAKGTLSLAWEGGTVEFLEAQKFALAGEMMTQLGEWEQRIRFRLLFRLGKGGEEISLVAGEYRDETDLPLEMTTIVLTEVNQLLQVRVLQVSGLQVVMNSIEIGQQGLTLRFSLEAET